MELTPAYGRDYKTKKAVVDAFNANLDFDGDYTTGFQLINKEQIPVGTAVLLRYKGNRAVTRVVVTK